MAQHLATTPGPGSPLHQGRDCHCSVPCVGPLPTLIDNIFSAYRNIIHSQKLKHLRANEIFSFPNFSLKSGALRGFQLGTSLSLSLPSPQLSRESLSSETCFCLPVNPHWPSHQNLPFLFQCNEIFFSFFFFFYIFIEEGNTSDPLKRTGKMNDTIFSW